MRHTETKLVAGLYLIFVWYIFLSLVKPQQFDAHKNSVAVIDKTYFAITSDGNLIAWGRNDHNLVSTSQFYWIPYWNRHTLLKNVTAVYANSCQAGAITTNGTLYLWGERQRNLPRSERGAVKQMEHVSKAGLGEHHIAALKTDGSLWLWGNNNLGQQGLGYRDTKIYQPHKVLDNILNLYTFGDTTFAINTDYELFAWGGWSNDRETDRAPLYAPQKVADAIQAVEFLRGSKYQLLTTNGEIFTFDVEAVQDGSFSSNAISSAPLQIGVAELYSVGFQKEDGSFWIWVWPGNPSDCLAALCSKSTLAGAACTSGNYIYVDQSRRIHIGEQHIQGQTAKTLWSVTQTMQYTFFAALAFFLILRHRKEKHPKLC